MKYPLALPAVCVVLVANVLSGAGDAPAERRSLKVEGMTVYYSPKDEGFAQTFAESLPQIAQEAREQLRVKFSDPAVLRTGTFRAHRDQYLSVIAYYLGLKKPTPQMKQTFDVALASVEKTMGVTLADWERSGLFDVVQIWREEDLRAKLRAREPDDYFQLNRGAFVTAKNGIMTSLKTDFVSQGPHADDRRIAVTMAPLRVGVQDRNRMFLPVILTGREPIDPGKEVPLQTAAARRYLAEQIGDLVEGTEYRLLRSVLHEVVEMAVVDHLLQSRDRRWFCEGMANFIAYRAIVEIDTPEAARRAYDLRGQLDMWKTYEREVNLPGWKVNEDLDDEERGSDFNRARYAYATKAISNVYEKHGREFFPRWCREIARTPRKKADIATVHVTYERLTREKLSDYYPRPLFSAP